MFLCILQARHLLFFVPVCTLKDFCIEKNLEDRTCNPPEQREGMFTAYYKRFRFPKFNIPLM